jgi:hypothetical protein
MNHPDHAAGVPANNSNANNREASRPEWVRIPKPRMTCPHSGLSRAHIHRLIKDGEIESMSLRKRGAKTGVRLVSYDSLMAYIRSTGEPGPKK